MWCSDCAILVHNGVQVQCNINYLNTCCKTEGSGISSWNIPVFIYQYNKAGTSVILHSAVSSQTLFSLTLEKPLPWRQVLPKTFAQSLTSVLHRLKSFSEISYGIKELISCEKDKSCYFWWIWIYLWWFHWKVIPFSACVFINKILCLHINSSCLVTF